MTRQRLVEFRDPEMAASPWRDPLVDASSPLAQNSAQDIWLRQETYRKELVKLNSQIQQLIGTVRALPSAKFNSPQMAGYRAALRKSLADLAQVAAETLPQEG